MSNIAVQDKNMLAVESALVRNDISKLSLDEKMSYINNICKTVGLNPLTKPFSFLTLQGKEVIYATKDCSEQLRKIHGVSTQIVKAEFADGFFEVHIRAQDKSGRTDEDFASIPIGSLKGNDLANLKMKCITKAKRRVTLSICGLGMLDESELDTIANIEHSLKINPQAPNPLKEIREHIESKQAEQVHTPDVLNDDELPTLESLGEYVCKVGKKYVGKRIADIDIFELDGYLKYIVNSAKNRNEELKGDWLEFYNNAEAYLVMNERKNLE